MDDVQKPFGKPCKDSGVQRMWDRCQWPYVEVLKTRYCNGTKWKKLKWKPSTTTLKHFNNRANVWWYYRHEMRDYEIHSKSLVIIYWKPSWVRECDIE